MMSPFIHKDAFAFFSPSGYNAGTQRGGYLRSQGHEEDTHMAIERQKEIRRRRKRREKLRKLRAKLAQATTEEERQRIIEKIRRISLRAPIEV